MIRIGIVDPDTSHARHFVRVLRQFPDVAVVGFLAKSKLRCENVLKQYAEEFSLEIYKSPEELVEQVDAVLILAADWNLHLTIAQFLLRNGIQVLIDKPIVGSFDDLDKLERIALTYPNMIFGGSALPYTEEIATIREHLRATERPSIKITSPGESFFTNIHSSEIAASIISVDASTLVTADGDSMQCETSDGAECRVLKQNGPWTIEIISNEIARRQIVNLENVYENYLKRFVDFLHGGSQSGLSVALNGVRLELARARSQQLGRPVRVSELDSTDVINPSEFLAEYLLGHRDESL